METDGLRLSSLHCWGWSRTAIFSQVSQGWQVQYASHTALHGRLAPWWGDGGNLCRGHVGAPGGALAAPHPHPGIDMRVSVCQR